METTRTTNSGQYRRVGGRGSDEWTLRCMNPLMGADVGVFQVADVPTYGYVYTLPVLTLIQNRVQKPTCQCCCLLFLSCPFRFSQPQPRKYFES